MPKTMSVSSAPIAADGMPARIVMRVDVALVEHAQQHVDHEERRDQQHDLARLRLLERGRVARPLGRRSRPASRPACGSAPLLREHRPARAGREVERERDRLELPAWLIAIGPTLRSTVATLDSGTSAPPLARRKILENADSSRRSVHGLPAGSPGRNPSGEDGRHLALAESRVERGADVLDLHARARWPCRGRCSSCACRPRSCASLVTSRKSGRAHQREHLVGALLQLRSPTLFSTYW
jgi:hypothetical protein